MAKNAYYNHLRQKMGQLIDQLQLPDLYKETLKERWLDQVIWADKKADQCRRWHYRLRLTTIIGGVILPALVGTSLQLGRSNPFVRIWLPNLAFGLSQIIAVSAAVEEFCRFGDRWRDYRRMSEDLKAEGWQYLQLSGPYSLNLVNEIQKEHRPVVPLMTPQTIEVWEPLPPRKTAKKPTNHLSTYTQFANRIESIIKQDVQNYISELIKQQAKQEQEVDESVQAAKSVSGNKTLIAQMDPNYAPPTAPYAPAAAPYPSPRGTPPGPYPTTPSYPLPPGSPPPGYPAMPGYSAIPGYPVMPGYPPTPGYLPPSSTPGTPHHGASELAPSVPPPVSSNLNGKIVAAANSLKGMSTADGPDGGNNACAWTVNRVLKQAGIAPLGDNPNYVPSLVEALKAGRGQLVTKQAAKAGDLVIACGEEHIGIGLDAGCQTVLSNSSSRACFQWESNTDFDGYYGGSSTVYRLIS